MTDEELPIRTTAPIRAIRRLPLGRTIALRLYNRMYMHFAPRQTASTYFGARMRVDIRDFLQATIFHYGTWEPNISFALSSLARPGDIVVDVGANVGYYTLLFGKKVGPGGRVIAIEAHPKTASVLRDNLRINGLGNVRIEQVAVSEVGDEAVLHEGPRSNGGSTTIVASRGLRPSYSVPARRLMTILGGEDIALISVIKIDIEGAEGPVLREIVENIHLFQERLAIAVEIDPRNCPGLRAIFTALAAHRFRAIQMRNDYRWEKIEEEARSPYLELSDLPVGVSDILFLREDDRDSGQTRFPSGAAPAGEEPGSS